MKKLFTYLLLLLPLAIASCGGDEPSGGNITNEDKYEYVNLGLTSGTLWATSNVGASKPEEYGDYFAWGETKPKERYDWTTYKWNGGENYNDFTKYCAVDGKTELDEADDAASANWGPNWRIPTKNQWVELKAECTWKWTSMNGVNGYLVTSKKNDNYIFLPAAGCLQGTGHPYYGILGKHGNYWTRNLDYGDSKYALYRLFFSESVTWDSGRGVGCSVRPVRVL